MVTCVCGNRFHDDACFIDHYEECPYVKVAGKTDRWAAQMSEQLVGYREGSLDEMLSRVIELTNIEKQHKRQEMVAKLFQEIHALHSLAEEIENA